MIKKISVVIALLIMSLGSYAQTRIGIRGGLQLNDLRNKPDDRTRSTTSNLLFGYNVGVVVDYKFNDILFFQSGLSLTSKGSKLEETFTVLGVTSTTTSKFNPMYVEVPLLFGLRVGTENLKFFAMAGPYLAYGVGGKSSFKSVLNNAVLIDTEEKITWGNETTLQNQKDLRKFDLGLTLSAGIEVGSGLQLGAFYSPGLVNISPDGSGRKLYNTSVGINATLLFGGKE